MAGAGASSRGRAPRGHDPWAPKPKEGGIFTKLLRCFMPQLTESGGTSSSTRYDRHRALSKMPSQKGAPPRALYRSRTLGATPMSRADSRRHNQGHSHHRVFDQLPSARSRNGRPELTASASMRSSSRALDANRGSSRPRSRQPRSAVGELLQRFGREPPGRFGRTLDAWAGSGARTEHRRREPSPESRFRRSASARSRRGFATIEAPSAREIRERRSSRHRLGATSFRHLTATAVEDEIARRTSEIEYERFTDDEEAERPAVSLAARSLRKIRSENYR
ncbi:unnamed protein product [Pedinophyceae sp. YPF-701]|nr:unnamed protein product [Pedinophyceae sp. YPF-701]